MESLREIAERVLNDEVQYMKSLLLLDHVYFASMPSLEKEPELQPLFTAFGAVESLEESLLLQMLGSRRASEEHVTLGDAEGERVMTALLDATSLVEVYQSYYTQYKRLLPTLSKHLSSDKYRDAQNAIVQRPESDGTSVENILSFPLSRVIAYRVELIALLNSPSSETLNVAGFRSLLSSLNSLCDRCAAETDEQQKRLELNAVWDTILSSSDASLLDSAKVLKQGDLERFGRHGFRPIRLVLMSNAIMNGKIVNGKIELRRSTDLRWVTLTNFSDAYLQHSFSLSTPSKTFILKTSSESEKRSWMNGIQEAIDALSHEETFCCSFKCENVGRALTREEQVVCRFCGKTCCPKCARTWDLVQNREQNETLPPLDPMHAPLKFYCKICPNCLSKAPEAEKEAAVDLEILPPGWVEKGDEESKYYYHNATHHAMFLHPNAAFFLEKENREEMVPLEWRRTYTASGEKYYQNLETGEVVWELPVAATAKPE